MLARVAGQRFIVREPSRNVLEGRALNMRTCRVVVVGLVVAVSGLPPAVDAFFSGGRVGHGKTVQDRKRCRSAAVDPASAVQAAHAIDHFTSIAALPAFVQPPLHLMDAAVATAEGTAKQGGLLNGFNPFAPLGAAWTAWRSFVQGSVVTLHDLLLAAGVKENTYGLAIILFTFSCRALTLPLLWVQYSSQEKMKAMQVIPQGMQGVWR